LCDRVFLKRPKDEAGRIAGFGRGAFPLHQISAPPERDVRPISAEHGAERFCVGNTEAEIAGLAARWTGDAPIATNPRPIRGAADLEEILRLAH
jgi:hypothetical protein